MWPPGSSLPVKPAPLHTQTLRPKPVRSRSLRLQMPRSSLARLSARMPLHLCSNTPEATVRAHVAARGWGDYFRSVDGHPTAKRDKLAALIAQGGLDPQRVAMVGDGVSDAEAAAANGCVFFAITAADDLARIGLTLEGTHV